MAKSNASKEKLKRYVEVYKKKGYSADVLEKHLINLGYDKELVGSAIKDYERELKRNNFGEQENKLEVEKNNVYDNLFSNLQLPKLKIPLVIAISILIIAVIATNFFSLNGYNGEDTKTPKVEEPSKVTVTILNAEPFNCKNDKKCFLAYAQRCDSAMFTQKEADAEIKYTSSEECEIEKKITKIPESEPEDLRLLLEGKSMFCVYEPGKLDASLSDNLLEGIEFCTGELKNALLTLHLELLDAG